ncbi:hypothetical protein [Chryseobacterium hagamense]|uniref:LysM domain-containing protein n=1 Tax=Chryseobacterium hagamense TaxID=395935 RepID=A0A511YSE5_9FLAO|nr:hypothetical protein [Chryseobacterium hagamense]GEN78121.1 hypothetical protein CHA01nite_38610 [Chryseobacterium hagamense]
MTIHFILSGETLESIAEEIHLENPEYLKEFHNTRCAREDIIDKALVPGKKLMIPDPGKIREYNSRNDAPFKHPRLNPQIPFHPENFSRIFSVVNKDTEDNGLEEKSNTLTYTVSLKWLRKEEDHHLFQIFKNNFSEGNGSMMADLASESIRSLNPVEVRTDFKGNVLQVSLPEETLKNFGKIKERLTDLFPDEYAKIYLDEFETVVLARHLFNLRMKEDVFIKTYFAALRNRFENGKSFLRQSVGEENIPLDIQQQVESPDYDQEIVLIQNSDPAETDQSFTGKYRLDAEAGMVKEIEIDYTISLSGVKNSSFLTMRELS